MAVKESIFGVEAPKFIDAEDNEVLLDYFVVLKDEPDFGTVRHSSIINRHREWVDKGDHWIFEGLIHLFKYPAIGEAEGAALDLEEFYLLLQSYYKRNVILYKRRDGSPFVNKYFEPIYFRLDKLEPVFFNAKGYPDVLLISFKSVEPVYGMLQLKLPTTIFQFYGENWSPPHQMVGETYVGPSVTGNNSKETAPELNNRYVTSAGNQGITLLGDLEPDESNYVLFWIGKVTSSTAWSASFNANQVLATFLGAGGGTNHGYRSDGVEYIDSISGQDVTEYKIQCLILENPTGKLYIGGGSPVLTGDWTPAPLIATSGFPLIAQGSSNFIQTKMAHLSIHRFQVNSIIRRSWVNDYANNLVSYYNSTISWTEILQGQ